MKKRLTNKEWVQNLIEGYDEDIDNVYEVYIKLGKLEDLMELYHCNSIDYLKTMLENWDKLKEFMQSEHDWGLENDYQDCSYGIRLILDKMQELEPKGDE